MSYESTYPEYKRELYRYYLQARNSYSSVEYVHVKHTALGRLYYLLFLLDVNPMRRRESNK